MLVLPPSGENINWSIHGGSTAWVRRHYLSLKSRWVWTDSPLGQYEPFSAITERSLRHTLAASELSLQTDAINDLMWAYDSLSTFPDVGPALTELSATPGVKAVVFSNGTESMVSNSVGKSSDLSPYSKVFERLIVVEDARRFKPDPTVYRMLARKMGRDEADMSSLWLISSNAFDVLGARAVGMQAVWVDRSGAGWADALLEGDAGKPTAVVQDLGDVLDAIKKHADLS